MNMVIKKNFKLFFQVNIKLYSEPHPLVNGVVLSVLAGHRLYGKLRTWVSGLVLACLQVFFVCFLVCVVGAAHI